jgi:hypothetical protein
MPTTGRPTGPNLSLAGLAAQNIANRLTAGTSPPNRGAAMFPPGGRRSAAVSNAFGARRRKRRRHSATKRKVRRVAKSRRSKRTSFRKLTKGSNAAKRHMARLRALRKKRR